MEDEHTQSPRRNYNGVSRTRKTQENKEIPDHRNVPKPRDGFSILTSVLAISILLQNCIIIGMLVWISYFGWELVFGVAG